MADDDLHRSLRAVADRLDQSAPPPDVDDVRTRPSRPRRHRARALAAAAIVAVVGTGVARQVLDDDDRQQVAAGDRTAPFPTGTLRLTTIEVNGESILHAGFVATMQVDPVAGSLQWSACNQVSRTVVVERDRLDVSGDLTTLVQCSGPTQVVEDALHRLFRANPTWAATGDGVVLRSPDITAAFTVVEPPADGFPH